MKTISEGHQSAQRILREIPVMRRTEPSRRLFDPLIDSQLRYTPAAQTDIRKTLAQFGLFGVKA